MKTNQEINALIEETRENKGFISIKGYENAKGAITDYIVQPLGPNGYKRLIQESLDQINNIENTKFDKEVFNAAKSELIASFEKTLNDEHNRVNNYSKEKTGFYSHEDNDCTYIRNLVVVRRIVRVPGEYKEVKSRPKTLAKNFIRRNLPISKYQGTFKLDSSKFDEIRFDKNIINTL